jgi:hypothetical protein
VLASKGKKNGCEREDGGWDPQNTSGLPCDTKQLQRNGTTRLDGRKETRKGLWSQERGELPVCMPFRIKSKGRKSRLYGGIGSAFIILLLGLRRCASPLREIAIDASGTITNSRAVAALFDRTVPVPLVVQGARIVPRLRF